MNHKQSLLALAAGSMLAGPASAARPPANDLPAPTASVLSHPTCVLKEVRPGFGMCGDKRYTKLCHPTIVEIEGVNRLRMSCGWVRIPALPAPLEH